MDGSPQCGSLHATTLWHLDAAERPPSTASKADMCAATRDVRLAPKIDREREHEISEPKFRRSGRGDTLVCGRSGFFGHETGAKALQLLTLLVP